MPEHFHVTEVGIVSKNFVLIAEARSGMKRWLIFNYGMPMILTTG